MANWKAIAGALQGFGAGVQGNGPQYLQGIQQQKYFDEQMQRQRQEQRSQDNEQVKRKMAQEFMVAYQNLSSGNPAMAAEALRNISNTPLIGSSPAGKIAASALNDLSMNAAPVAAKKLESVVMDVRARYPDMFPQPEAYTLGEGQARFVGGQKVAENPKSPNFNQPFFPDGRPNTAYQNYAERMGRSSATNVNIGGNDYLGQRGGDQAGMMGELEKSAVSAYQANNALNNFIRSSAEGDAGGAQPLMTATKNFLASFGFNPEGLTDTALMEQAIGEILGSKMQELGARGLTDRDMDTLRQALPRVNTSREARVAVANVIQKANSRVIEEYLDAAKWEQQQYPQYQFRRPSWFDEYSQPISDDRYQQIQPGQEYWDNGVRYIKGGR